jgi:hypothetical protein
MHRRGYYRFAERDGVRLLRLPLQRRREPPLVAMMRSGGMLSEPMAFTVDHAFLLLTHSRGPAAVLFMGRVIDPR